MFDKHYIQCNETKQLTLTSSIAIQTSTFSFLQSVHFLSLYMLAHKGVEQVVTALSQPVGRLCLRDVCIHEQIICRALLTFSICCKQEYQRETEAILLERKWFYMCASQCIPITIGIKEMMEAEPLQTISKQCYVISDNHRD